MIQREILTRAKIGMLNYVELGAEESSEWYQADDQLHKYINLCVD